MAKYPKHLEPLLRKAGLIGKKAGYVEIRAIDRVIEETVSTNQSDDSLVWETRKIPVAGRLNTWLCPAVGKNGLIKGYWANKLSKAEQDLIHHEAGVPYYYYNNDELTADGKYKHSNTRIFVIDGERLYMDNPIDVAKFLVLLHAEGIGKTRKDALDNVADFYFFSIEEERKNKQELNKQRIKAVSLIEDLSIAEKRQLLRVMAYQGNVHFNHYMDSDDIPEFFSDQVFAHPRLIVQAYNVRMKDEFIMAKSLLSARYIKGITKNGPFVKDPERYGDNVIIAKTFDELIDTIGTHHDLVRAFNEMEEQIKGRENRDNPDFVPQKVTDYMEEWGLGEFEEKDGVKVQVSSKKDDNALAEVISKANRMTIFKMLEQQHIEHDFDAETDINDIRQYAIDNL